MDLIWAWPVAKHFLPFSGAAEAVAVGASCCRSLQCSSFYAAPPPRPLTQPRARSYSFWTPGNVYRLHKRKSSSKSGEQRSDLDPRGGRLPNIPVAENLSSPSARGLGVAYVSFRVRPRTARGIAGFYREVFGAEVEEISGGGGGGAGGGGGGGDGDCAAGGGNGSEERSCSATVSGVLWRVVLCVFLFCT